MRLSTYDSLIIKSASKDIIIKDSDINELISKSEYNKSYVPVVTQLQKSKTSIKRVRELYEKGEKNLKQQQKTIDGIQKVLSKSTISYLISRTKRTIPYVTFDIDIIVPTNQFENAVLAFEKHGYLIKKHGRINGIKKNHQMTARKKGHLLIDIHKNVSWFGSYYIGEDDIWNKHCKGTFFGKSYPMPNPTVELLLLAANVIFEKFHLTILDYLYIKSLLGKADIKKAKSISEKYGWDELFNSLISFVQALENDKRTSKSEIFILTETLSFPLVIKPQTAFRIFINRIFSGYGVSLVAAIYVSYMYIKMFVKNGSYYPYFFKN